MLPGGSQLSGVLPATRVPVRLTVPSWLTMPPPAPDAELPVILLPLMVSTPLPPVGGNPKLALAMPPPTPGVPVLSVGAMLPVIRLPAIVIVPWLAMPAPTLAELWSTELPRMTARPPLAMPPAAPPASVAVLWSTRLPLRVRLLPLTGESGLPGPLAIPAPLPEVLPDTRLALRMAVPAWFKMPPASPEVVLPVTWVALSTRVPAGPVPIVPLAMPPPAAIIPPSDALPDTTLAFRRSVPALLNAPPLGPGTSPPVIVSALAARLPPGPSTSRMRK